MIPRKLYRGDSDPQGIRHLKATIEHYQLQSNLISGGIGNDIITIPLQNLVNRHVGYGWGQTHFLSFSSDEMTAKRFGIGCRIERFHDQLNEYVEYHDIGSNWHFALLELDTALMEIRQLEQGVYEGFYSPTLIEFARLYSKFRIVIIDVLDYLFSLDNSELYADALASAERDKEYLILPATPMEYQQGRVEFSAKLDGGCIRCFTKYRKD